MGVQEGGLERWGLRGIARRVWGGLGGSGVRGAFRGIRRGSGAIKTHTFTHDSCTFAIKALIQKQLLPPSRSGLAPLLPLPTPHQPPAQPLLPVILQNANLLSVISRVSLPLGQLVSDRLHTRHADVGHSPHENSASSRGPSV